MSIAAGIQVMHYRGGKFYRCDASRIAYAKACAVRVTEVAGAEIITFTDGSSIIAADDKIHFWSK